MWFQTCINKFVRTWSVPTKQTKRNFKKSTSRLFTAYTINWSLGHIQLLNNWLLMKPYKRKYDYEREVGAWCVVSFFFISGSYSTQESIRMLIICTFHRINTLTANKKSVNKSASFLLHASMSFGKEIYAARKKKLYTHTYFNWLSLLFLFLFLFSCVVAVSLSGCSRYRVFCAVCCSIVVFFSSILVSVVIIPMCNVMKRVHSHRAIWAKRSFVSFSFCIDILHFSSSGWL